MMNGDTTTADIGTGMSGDLSSDPAGGQASGQDAVGGAAAVTPPAPEHGYFDDLPRGIVVTAEDRPIMDGFANAMHAVGAPKEAVHQALHYHQELVANQRAQIERLDSETRAEALTAMAAKWGQQGLQANVELMRNFLNGLPPGVGGAIANARMEDGRALLNSPAALEWLVSLARSTPATSMQSAGAGRGQAPQASNDGVDAEIAKIENFMRKNRTAYNRDEALQANYRKLLAQKHGGA